MVVMALLSVVIYEVSIKGGISISMEGGHVRTLKGEEYETVLTVESRGSSWIGSIPTTFKIDTGQLMKIEPMGEGKIKLKFQGKFAGRTEGVRVGLSLTDPLKLMKRLDEIVYADFVLDTLPLSLLAPVAPRRLTVYGFGEQPTGYPGPGQELYGLDEYRGSTDTKDIIWKRVAKSPDERLIMRVREASVRDIVRVGVVQFADRGEERAAWVDSLCEALGQLGAEVFEMGASVIVHYDSPPSPKRKDSVGLVEEQKLGTSHLVASDVDELAEVIMSCSVAPPSREIETVVSESDFIVTGLKELEDERMSDIIAGKPFLLINERATVAPAVTDRSVIWTGKESLFPLIRKVLER